MGPIEPRQTTGARAAAAVIRDTGADPNFVTDQVIWRTEKPQHYEMAFRPDVDPGPMRYVCRADDCRALGTVRLSFTTEEELICHWNTFHVAVMPQFTCQHLGCGTVFAANPGSLDQYLLHIERRWKARLMLGSYRGNTIPTRQTRRHWLSSETSITSHRALKTKCHSEWPG